MPILSGRGGGVGLVVVVAVDVVPNRGDFGRAFGEVSLERRTWPRGGS